MTTELSARFRTLYTGAICDVLDELGCPDRVLPRDLLPLEAGAKFAGPAFAIEGRSNPGMDRERSMEGILKMLSAVPDGHVAVYQPHDDFCAHLGELSVAALQRTGCVAAVIDGGCRDVGHIASMDFPVLCRYTTPLDAVGRWEVLRYGHEVVLGGVRVATGDYVVADRDGVVVIPAELTDTVLAETETVARTENHVRDAVLAGTAPLEAYERFGRF